jgi:hypothetical protein
VRRLGLFLGLAMVLAAAPARSLGTPVVWTLRVSGAFALAGLVGPATGNVNLYLLSTAGHSVGFLLVATEVILNVRSQSRADGLAIRTPVS